MLGLGQKISATSKPLSGTSAVPPEIIETAATGIGESEATISAEFESQTDVLSAGFVYSTTSDFDPTESIDYGNQTGASIDNVNKNFTDDLSNLANGTIYYVQAYATNSTGATGYGSPVTFLTIATQVSTLPATSPIKGGTTINGSHSGSSSIDDIGFLYSLNPSTDSNGVLDAALTTQASDFASLATPFSFDVTYGESFDDYTLYYQAYVSDAYVTRYGEVQTALLGQPNPVVTTGSFTSIAANSVTANATYTSDVSLTASGFEYSTSPSMSSSTTVASTSSDSSSFSANITGLSESSTYYVRPFATSSYGTGYGTVESFTTSVAAGDFSPSNANYTIEQHYDFTEANGTNGFNAVFGANFTQVPTRVASVTDDNSNTRDNVLKITAEIDNATSTGVVGVNKPYFYLNTDEYYAISFWMYLPNSNSTTKRFSNFHTYFNNDEPGNANYAGVTGYEASSDDRGSWIQIAFEDLRVNNQTSAFAVIFNPYDTVQPDDVAYMTNFKIWSRPLV